MEDRGGLGPHTIYRALVAAALLSLTQAEVLTPPYFNLAKDRRIIASATCGEGVADPELYCKLVGAGTDHKEINFNLIQGQSCDICDPGQREKYHPAEYAINGLESWWQSPPLSRGMQYNEVNLTIDLGQLFQVAYVLIKMGNSPRPGVWALERSTDNGLTYTPWQYFANDLGECERLFGATHKIRNDDDVVCVTQFSKVVPLEGGEIVISLLNNRPSSKTFFNSTVLQQFTRATNVRLRLIRTKTLLGHLMSVARQDPTVTRRYFYSIKDISIGGRCVCNGHADECHITDPNDIYKLQCKCQHNTCGSQCETCCPGFIQKKWRTATYSAFFECEPCNCHGHTNECIYDEDVEMNKQSLDMYGVYEGGGVCQNCRHNTEGINCEGCKDKYYRPYGKELNDTDVCQPCQCEYFYSTGNCAEGSGQCECKPAYLPPFCDACNDGYYDYPDCKPCDCHREGTRDRVCEVGGRQCPCKDNFAGLNCDQCAPGFYNFPECLPCECDYTGTVENSTCDAVTGQCVCGNEFGGQDCDRCAHGYWNYPYCDFCNCVDPGLVEEACNKTTGDCLCVDGYSGDKCDTSAPGYYSYPQIRQCDCHERGSVSTQCHPHNGKCQCLEGYADRTCDKCSPGYYNFPECEPCNCDPSGSIGVSCDKDGKCQCKPNYDGKHCDSCREMFYNFPICEECNCNPSGVLESFGGCGESPVGELCACKERVGGRICNKCKPLFWNLQQNNPLGCEECSCHTPGTIGGISVCDSKYGQCFCKPDVSSRRCDTCQDGSFNLMEDNLFGCGACNCNIGGSVDNVCDKSSGQCRCRPRVTGQRCDQPLQLHYFPTLHQLKYEAEDGVTPQDTLVRFGYDDSVFRDYSWRGYAVFSEIQKEILYDIYIEKPSLYLVLLYYHNPGSRTIVGKIVATPDNPSDIEQVMDVHLPPTNGPKMMTVTTVPGGFNLPLVLNPGRWILSIENNQNLFLDYFVLLPQAYYEGTILSENVTRPCRLDDYGNNLCVHYSYPSVRNYDYIFGSAGYQSRGEDREVVELYEEYQVLDILQAQPMAWLNPNQQEVQYDIRLGSAGRYVILINYYTPSGSTATNVMVETSTQNGREKGHAILYDCTFTWTCRQAVTDLNGKVGVFNFDSNFMNVIIKGNSNTNIAIDSVVAIPYDEWHQDLIKPRPVCKRENGECLESFYSLPPETTKVEFESNLEGKFATILPEGVINGTGLVFLSRNDSMVDIVGKLRSAGDYVFVVHYYQPNYPDAELDGQLYYGYEEEYDLDVLIQNGQFYESSLPLQHCPSSSGCRAVILQKDGSHIFSILENFVLSLTNPNQKTDKTVWLDYVMVVPAAQYSQMMLHELPQDKTSEYISKCGKKNFYVDSEMSGFCKDAAFTLTMDYNSGALECGCDYYGSETFECENFGGQCQCKANVIGRTCNRCKTGYFGFPDCKKCNCPSTALCDPITGECICPPRVEGDRCQRCAPYTYGFDPIIGCEECQCSNLGVRAGDLQCDSTTGHCDCKNTVVGRRCDRCAAGHWSFPFCQLCNCDLRGTEEDICSQSDATCFCKYNVEQAGSCDTCQRGMYNLEESNPDGCTKCFCFGKSESCSSSSLYWDEVYGFNDWGAVMVQPAGSSISFSSLAQTPTEYSDMVQVDLTGVITTVLDGNVYFSAPQRFLGNRVTSYGGFLNYDIMYVQGFNGTDLSAPLIFLHGNNITALYYSEDEPISSETYNGQVRITEHNFRTLSGAPMKREQLMMLLYKMDGIFIRANYWTDSTEARLMNVSLEVPIDYGWKPALSVEHCQCPANYKGHSCEDCADGFFRAQTGPHGGFCIPCQCNGHADTCDPVTGKCISHFPAFLKIKSNCRHNTIGEHCEMCAPGYHGDASQGTPYDCLICACPLPSITNNFADTCEVTPDGFSIACDCQPGYIGQQCERCSPGFYGQPEVLGSSCQPCECNENIEPQDPFACDDITGRCLTCLNSTYGDECERCAPGYYGDAIVSKNCQSCTCDDCGTRECKHYDGVCECHNNVIGNNCEQCAQDHWGFASCQGCQHCQCGLASMDSQCDEGTGQCDCRSGVTGQRCDQCRPGYWNYTQDGCQECSCRRGFSVGVGCDPVTGQCSCLQGVIGANCDGCPNRWVLIDGVGCRECDECIHALLDTTDELHAMIQPTIDEFESAAHSYFLHQRLGSINETVFELRPLVDTLQFSESSTDPIQGNIDNIVRDAQSLLSQAGLTYDRAEDSATEGHETHKNAIAVQNDVDSAFNLARDIVQEINKLVIGLETGTGAQIEQAIREAEAIVADMQTRSFDEQRDKVELELEHAKEILDKMKNFYEPIKDQADEIDNHSERLSEFEEKLEDMRKYIETAVEQTNSAKLMNRNNKLFGREALKKKIAELRRLEEEMKNQLIEGQSLVQAGGDNLMNATQNYILLLSQIDQLHNHKSKLNDSVAILADELEKSQIPAKKAQQHSSVLQQRAGELDDLLADTRQVAESALAAANAYKNIVLAIEDAMKAAQDAKNSAEKAKELSSGVMDSAQLSLTESESKASMANSRAQQVQFDLIPQLDRAQQDVEMLKMANRNIKHKLDVMKTDMDHLEEDGIGLAVTKQKQQAEEARKKSDDALNMIKDIESNLMTDAEKARTLMKLRFDGGKALDLATESVSGVERVVPEMNQLSETLMIQKETIQLKSLEVSDRLEKLRQTIKKTRELANKIKVGVEFDENTVIEVQNPEDLTSSATSTKVSVYVRTEETTGLIMFMGTPEGGHQNMWRTRSDDFMALEIDGGFVRLTTDLGAGAHTIENSKVFVSDGVWRKISLERTGKVVKLSVHQEDNENNEKIDSVEEVIPGEFTVFNLDPKISKMYIGGIPEEVLVDKSLQSTSFYGQMEDLRINDRPVGFWNFMMDGTDNVQGRGAIQRDRLVDLVPPTGLRFDGSGYSAMGTRNGYRFSKLFDIQLEFKTYAEDGILFLVNDENTFISLTMEAGHLVFQYDLGTGMATCRLGQTYNDGEWHHVEASRKDRNGIIKVGSVFQQCESPGYATSFNVPENMYFGGYPGEHEFIEVTNDDFYGCIDRIVMSRIPVDLSTSKDTLNVAPGCPVQVANTVSFDKSAPGFVELESPEGNGVQLVFKFRTQQPNGLLFYSSTVNQDDYISLSISDGSLHLRTPQGQLTTGSYHKYNDSEWHVVYATREHSKLNLRIDDYEDYSLQVPEEAVTLNGAVYFGGVPSQFRLPNGAVATPSNFVGCIADATLNVRIINFASSTNRQGAFLQKCSLEKTAIESVVQTPLPASIESLDHCALPITPRTDPDADDASGPRFDDDSSIQYGSKKDSRIEYESLPANPRANFKFSFDLKTSAEEGVIFYGADDNHKDFISIYMKDSQLVFSYNPGAGVAVMRSNQPINDDEWHSVIAERRNEVGSLYIDGYLESNGTSRGPAKAKHIDLKPPYYLGGLPQPAAAQMARSNTESTDLSLSGCIKDMRLNNIKLGGQRQVFGVEKCSNKVEPGIFFGQGVRSHVILRPRFSVGRVFELSMDIKPRVNNGVLMSVHGKRDFVMLQMKDGDVILSVDNGRGIITAKYTPATPWSLCDGDWHRIKVIKNKNVAILVVDNTSTNPVSGKIGATSADTKHPLFLGTQPRIGQRRGDPTTDKYVGCMKNVQINREIVDLAYTMFVGNVNAGSCPTI